MDATVRCRDYDRRNFSGTNRIIKRLDHALHEVLLILGGTVQENSQRITFFWSVTGRKINQQVALLAKGIRPNPVVLKSPTGMGNKPAPQMAVHAFNLMETQGPWRGLAQTDPVNPEGSKPNQSIHWSPGCGSDAAQPTMDHTGIP
jgi:hypothetical protein